MIGLTGRINQQEPRFGDWGVVVVSLREDELGEWPGWQTILLLQGAVVLVLLIACANLANLLLARAVSRGKEIAIRLAMGGSRWRIVRQLLMESLLLALLGGAAGVALAAIGIEAAKHWLAAQEITLWTDVRLEPAVLAFSVGLAALTGIVFGLVPAWQTTKADVQTALKGTSRNATGGVAGQPEAVIYVPTAQGWFKGSNANYRLAFAVRTAGDPLALAQSIQAEIRALDPEMAFAAIQPLERAVNGSLLSQRLSSFMLGSFSLMALLLAALGIYGVMANAVSQRTNELGLRMALGAQASDILRLVVGRGLWLTALGVAGGLIGAFGLTRFLTSLLSDISPTDPWVFVGVTLFLVLIALLACWLPARRATKVNPLEALRAE
jgi:ABC-type antimicrobial peptide transport system permease subunit